MKLSDAVQGDPAAVDDLRHMIDRGELPGITLRHAMEFLLSDGILPENDLPLDPFLRLEDWARVRLQHPMSE
jgi:hypothetical protein